MSTLTNHSSKIRISGSVAGIFNVPNCTDLTVFLLSGKPGGTTNQLLLCCSGDWRISTSFVAVSDMLEISQFDVRSAPDDLDLSNFPAGIICAYPSMTTELTVIRAKRVHINYSNVGSLSALDLTEREQKIAQYVYDQSFPQLLPPPHQRVTKEEDAAKSVDLDRSSRAGRGLASSALTVPGSPKRSPSPRPSQNTLPSTNSDRNLFCSMDKFYDVIYGQRSIIDRKVQFVERILSARTRVLDLGCGPGLFAFALRADGIKCTCVDASPVMERAIREKNAFVADVEGPQSLLKGAPIPFHRADLSSFSLTTVDTDGREKYTDFPAILAIDVLALLPSIDHVQKALQNMALHTSREGVAIVSIPNVEHALLIGNTQTSYRREIDKFSLSVGASACLPQGVLDVTEQVLVRQIHAKDELHPTNRLPELSDGVPRRTVTVVGNVFHPRAATENSMFVSFTERYTELLISSGRFEQLAKAAGFAVEGIYGAADGSVFSKETSPSCVYVMKRI